MKKVTIYNLVTGDAVEMSGIDASSAVNRFPEEWAFSASAPETEPEPVVRKPRGRPKKLSGK